MPGVFPDYPAPVVRNAGIERELRRSLRAEPIRKTRLQRDQSFNEVSGL
jgi:hypothetical protein